MDLCRSNHVPFAGRARPGKEPCLTRTAVCAVLAGALFGAAAGGTAAAWPSGDSTGSDVRLERPPTPAEVAAYRRAQNAEGPQSASGPVPAAQAATVPPSAAQAAAVPPSAAQAAVADPILRLPAQRGAPRGTDLGGTNRTDYRIRARLDEDGRTLAGELELDWTNGGDRAAPDLWFHLYLNAFANDRSTHVRLDPKMGDRLAEEDAKGDGFGFSRVTGMWLLRGEEEVDLLPRFTPRTPSGNTDDRTVFSVDLPEPVEAGGTARVRIQWESRVPRAERRTGQKDDFFLMAQWFPKLGVWEDERGWNCHEFHAFTEWYSDFGTYDVALDLPGAYEDKVGASGLRVGSERRGDRVEVRFLAPSEADRNRRETSGRTPLVHDFTWTADPGFAVHRTMFQWRDWAERYPAEVERARAAFGADVVLELRDVEVVVLLQPERVAQAERHAFATEAALFFYGLWYGEYPYERITVVDPAYGSNAGGMEYPTLFTAGTRLLTRPSMHVPESVTVHEAGHQWFYGMVANNEFEAAWLDEGINSYTDSEVIARVWGDRIDTTTYAGIPIDGVRLARFGVGTTGRALALREWPLGWLGVRGLTSASPLAGSGFIDWWRDQPWLTAAPRREDPRWNDRTRYLSSPDKDPIDTIAWHALDRSSHYTNSYGRTAVALRSMPAVIAASKPGLDGWAEFHRAMRGFALDWRYRHPYPDDFFSALAARFDPELDLSWYFEDVFRGTGTIDWSLSVEQRRVTQPKGWFPGADGVFVQRTGDTAGAAQVAETAQAAMDGVATAAAGNAVPPLGHDVEVVVRKRGGLAAPVVVALAFADGTTERFVWTRAEQQERAWLRWEKRTPAKLVSAAVDPDRGYFIDGDLSNNRWFAEADAVSPWRWAERAGSQFLRQLHFQARVGG